MLISDAFAQATTSSQGEAGLISLLPMIAIIALFYFLLIRPQMKRAKEHKKMVADLQRGDEVITNGGILGQITNVSEMYVIVEIAPATEVTVLKSGIQTLLPKGTLKSIEPKGRGPKQLKSTKTGTAENKTDETMVASDNNDANAEKK